MPAETLMTRTTYDILGQRLEELRNAELALEATAADAFGNAADWHDNAAYDDWRQQSHLLRTQINSIQEKLHSAQIIQPNYDTRQASVGHRIVVQYSDNAQPEVFTILGPDDATCLEGVISYESALGMQMIGQVEGSEVELSNGYSVTLLQVLAGDFY